MSGVAAKEHKLIRVRTKDDLKEISKFDDTIISGHLKREAAFVRYYFFVSDEYERAYRLMTGGS